MQPVPQMLKRTVDEIGEIEQVNPVRHQTPFDVIKGSIVSTCSNAIEVISKFTPDDILEYRKQHVHAINFTDFQLSGLALPEQLPSKMKLSDALKSREYQYMSVDNFVDNTMFVNYARFVNKHSYSNNQNINSVFVNHSRDVGTALFLLQNADTLLADWFKHVPLEFGDIKLTAEQIMAGITLTTPLPFDTTTIVNKTEIFLKAGNFPSAQTVTAMPGAGKTAVAMCSARYGLLSESTAASFNAMNQAVHIPITGGFSTRRESIILVPAVLFVTPTPLMKQTIASAQKYIGGSGITIWQGIGHRTLKDAHALGGPIFWIVPQNQTTTQMLIDSKGYGYYADYIDEFNRSMSKRGNPDKAAPMQTIIIQATPAKLMDAAAGKPKMLLRTEFCRPGQPFSMENDFTNACMLNSMLPDWLRIAWNKKAVSMMPDGFHMHNVRARAGTNLNGVFGHANAPLVPRSLAQNISSIVPIRSTSINEAQLAEFQRRADAGLNPMEVVTLLSDIKDTLKTPASERHLVSNLSRMIENMTTMITSDDMECPVLLIPITPETGVTLPCCSNVLHRDAIAGLQTRTCPMCRQKLTDTFHINNEPALNTVPTIEFSGSLEAGLAIISEQRLTSTVAIEKIILNILARKNDARIILSSHNANDGRVLIADICNQIRRYHPTLELYFIGARNKKQFNPSTYNDSARYPAPQIVVLNTSNNTNNSQGLDLPNTFATIIVGHSRSDIKAQLVGRCCRSGQSGSRTLVHVDY